MREYFYGTSGDLCPHSTVVDFKVCSTFLVSPFICLNSLPLSTPLSLPLLLFFSFHFFFFFFVNYLTIFQDIVIYQIGGGPAAPLSALPIGMSLPLPMPSFPLSSPHSHSSIFIRSIFRLTLKIGAEPTLDPVQLLEVAPSMDLLHSVLAVSHADTVEAIKEKNVAGFIYVYEKWRRRRERARKGGGEGRVKKRGKREGRG